MVEKPDERLLPTNKVRTIMKSCGDPSAFLSKESVLVVTKAAELFISYLTQQTHKKCAHKKDLNYNDLSSFVQEEEKLEFLHQIVPKKITVKEFREILERGSESESSDSEEEASSDEEHSDEEVDEEEDMDEADESESDNEAVEED
ncbi:chromatin accessibility complex protein 1-like [Sitodiplosis mosellana]|uniref:chromatin accessibility complex protein 1-like n=1 Tax=Sitodiplosis mosellana TaxID=263140 RepID=UPI0024444294|nr:chromatin accessibility complex protein 1-like [Sitodiplosis mosellana]